MRARLITASALALLGVFAWVAAPALSSAHARLGLCKVHWELTRVHNGQGAACARPRAHDAPVRIMVVRV